MARQRIEGICHLCGRIGQLSYEHVPPEAAFNDQPIREQPVIEALNEDLDAAPRGHVNQRGAGAYTLCEPCNNKTGHWYGNAFVNWCYQGRDVLVRSNFKPKLIYLHYILPLRVLKQIYTMAFSVNVPNWRRKHPELEQFVLDKERRWLNPRYRTFVYYNVEGTYRQIGNQNPFIDFFKDWRLIEVTEISFPPFGYVMTCDGTRPDKRLYEITHFCRYGYNGFEMTPLYLPVLPTILPIPLDYRTKGEIRQQADESADLEQVMGT